MVNLHKNMKSFTYKPRQPLPHGVTIGPVTSYLEFASLGVMEVEKNGRDDIRQCYMYTVDTYEQLVKVIVDNCYVCEDAQSTETYTNEVRSWIDEFILTFVRFD